LRTRYAQVFAAPSLPALHDPLIHVQYAAIDPCGNNPTPEQRVNCAANGVPGGAYVQSEPEFPVTAGGSPDLQPETGHTFGAGVTYTPASVEGLSVSIDYSRVVIRGFVNQAFPEQVLLGCADYGTREWCDAIDRLPDGSISRVYTLNENFGYHENRAFDVAIDWHGATRLGELTAAVQATYLDRWDEQYFPDEAISHWAGKGELGALPRWQALGSIDWRHGRWLASYAAEYIGNYTEPVEAFNLFDFPPYRRTIDAVLYHDVEAGFEFDSGLAVRAVISNVLDEDPPYVNGGSIANTDEATYRLLGRSYFVEIRYRMQ
jgi:outer membrane receptor protein involved in Fe transport